jgi:hypothetical protein
MKLLGIREFRNKVSHHLASGEVLGIQNHGRLIGIFMPIRSPDPQKLEEAAERLAMSVEKVMQETGISAQELEALFDLSAKNTTVDTDADRR